MSDNENNQADNNKNTCLCWPPLGESECQPCTIKPSGTFYVKLDDLKKIVSANEFVRSFRF